MSGPTVRPYPMIHAPTGAARRKVIDAIYAQGWTVAGLSRDTVETYLTDASVAAWGSDLIVLMGHSFLFDSNRAKGTMVNSVSHLISYCKTLGPRAPRVYLS